MATAKHLYVVARKGGVGKTTITRFLAEYFAQNKRVLVVDYDDQCNLSKLLLQMEHDGDSNITPPVHPDYDVTKPLEERGPKRPSSADIFKADREIAGYDVTSFVTNARGTLYLLPSDERELRPIKENDATEVRESVSTTLRDWFRRPELEEQFDLIIYDTGPGESALMRGCLMAATHVLIVTEAEPQSIEGLDSMVNLLNRINKGRPADDKAELIGIVANKFRKALSIHKGLLSQLQRNPAIAPLLMPEVVPDLSAFKERDLQGVAPDSVFKLRPSDPARQSAEGLGRLLSKRIFGGKKS